MTCVFRPPASRLFLRHLGVWHDPPAPASTPEGAGNYTRVPFDDVDPMLD